MDAVSYFSENRVVSPSQTVKQTVNTKKSVTASSSGALNYLLWSIEIFAAAIAILIGIIVCSFCRYSSEEETDKLNQPMNFQEFEYATYEEYPEQMIFEGLE